MDRSLAGLAGAGTAIDIHRVVKHYKDNTAVDDVTLHVRQGEFLTLLGASGSGKSTLLNILAGFVEPSAGRIELGGRDITAVPPHRRGLGMVFQHYALFPHMSVWDNVAFPLRRRKVAKAEAERRVRQALDLVELGGLARRRPAQLSGGQQQRVALARAIVFQPHALLMDEPLGALDRRLREQLQLEIKHLHEDLGTTVLFVTHDQEEALTMSDRIAVLRNGKLVQVGTPEDLYERPCSVYVARFLGESNVFSGRCDGERFVDGSTTAAFAVGRGASGASALVVRPEDLQLSAEGGDVPTEHNGVSGVVREVVYLGSGLRIDVVLADGRALVVRAGARGELVPRPGLPVIAHWHPERSLVLRDDTADADVSSDEPAATAVA